MKSSAQAKALIAALGPALSQDLMTLAASEASFRRAQGAMAKKDFEIFLARLKSLGYEARVAPVEFAPELCFKVIGRCKICDHTVLVATDLTEVQARRMALHGVGAFPKLHVDVEPQGISPPACYGRLEILGILPR